jgi:hypothetical protein
MAFISSKGKYSQSTKKILTIIVLEEMSYRKSDHHILDEPFLPNAPLPYKYLMNLEWYLQNIFRLSYYHSQGRDASITASQV